MVSMHTERRGARDDLFQLLLFRRVLDSCGIFDWQHVLVSVGSM